MIKQIKFAEPPKAEIIINRTMVSTVPGVTVASAPDLGNLIAYRGTEGAVRMLTVKLAHKTFGQVHGFVFTLLGCRDTRVDFTGTLFYSKIEAVVDALDSGHRVFSFDSEKELATWIRQS